MKTQSLLGGHLLVANHQRPATIAFHSDRIAVVAENLVPVDEEMAKVVLEELVVNVVEFGCPNSEQVEQRIPGMHKLAVDEGELRSIQSSKCNELPRVRNLDALYSRPLGGEKTLSFAPRPYFFEL